MKCRRSFIIGLLLLFQMACTSTPNKDEPIARVNGHSITIRDYLNLFETLKPKEMGISGREKAEIKNIVLKNLVRSQVILTEAENRRVNLTEKEFQEGLERFKEGYTSATFEQSLLEQMVDEKEWKEQIRQNLLIEKIFDSTETKVEKPNLKEALEFYESNSNLFHQNARCTALQIVVKDKRVAEEIRRQVVASPASFVTIAHDKSIGPEGVEDAKINVDKDTLTPELDKALFEGKIGEISPIIESPYGFHILKVLERTPAINKDFEEVRPQITKRLIQDHRNAWLARFEEKLIREAQIEYNRDLIEKL